MKKPVKEFVEDLGPGLIPGVIGGSLREAAFSGRLPQQCVCGRRAEEGMFGETHKRLKDTIPTDTTPQPKKEQEDAKLRLLARLADV